MKHYILIGDLIVISFCGFLMLAGCRKAASANRQPEVSIHFPDEMLSNTQKQTQVDLQKVKVTPFGAKLSGEELLGLNSIFQNLIYGSQATSREILYLPQQSDLYASLRASLENEHGWHILEIQANKEGRIALYSVAAFIEATQRPKR